MMSKVLTIRSGLILALLLFLLTGCADYNLREKFFGGVIKVDKSKILYDEDIVVDGLTKKRYYYISDIVSKDAISENQIIKYEGNKKIGIVYPFDAFYKEGEVWKEVKTDIVDKKAYEDEMKQAKMIDSLLRGANADTASFTPYNDGNVIANGASWATCYGNTDGYTVGTTYSTECEWYTSDNTYYCSRSFLTLNVVIGADETISSSTLWVFGASSNLGDGTMGLYSANSYGTLTTADFDQVDITSSGVEATRYSDTIYGTTTQGVYTQWSNTNWNGFKLNASGISHINQTGESFWSLRNYQWDGYNTAMSAKSTENILYGVTSSGTNKPYLKIVYASSTPAPSGAVPPQMIIIE